MTHLYPGGTPKQVSFYTTRRDATPKTLYIREDHLLDRIRHDRGLHRHHPALRSPDPEEVAAYLRTSNMIMCGHHAWTIESETAIYTLHPPGSCLTTTAKIPAQRDGDHAKHEEASRFVWNNVSEIRTRVPSTSAGKRCAWVDRSHCGAHCNSPTEASVPGLFDAVAPGAKPV
ncbi:hypothetical protein [Micromonospora sp. ATA51]|uniref:hypothetical protein n=1 Tax=Micromonospora sp. ATA51 TaxID=2806098 RepID=UPI001A5825A6|nr:hypothetical protein [Micromonospora sp. ATA51]MBM0225531.1 hypothetical protein [Micromonospora sp. ATA51]